MLYPGAGPLGPITRQRRSRLPMDRRVPVGHNLMNGLAEFWPLNEQADLRRGVHAGLNLTDNNTVTGADGIGSLASQFTRANSEHLSRASESALQTGDIDFTLAGWCRLDSKPAARYGGIIAKDDVTSAREYYLGMDQSSDRLNFLAFNSSNTVIANVLANTFGSPTTGVWIFVVGWHDSVANSCGISVNAGTADTAATTGNPQAAGAEFRIGSDAYSVTPARWDGQLQRVGFWKRVLTADERTWLYNGGRGRDYPFV